MSQWNEGIKTFTSAEALAKFRRVKLDSNLAVVYADAGEDYIGVTLYAVADATSVAVKLKNFPGTVKITAAGALTARDVLWGAADGKVDDTAAGEVQFYALESATADGDVIEALPWADVGNFFTSIDDTNGNEEIVLTATASAVNHLAVTNAATAGTPSLKSAGDDAAVSLLIGVKGTGDITVTSGDDLSLQSGVAASDLVSIQAYDVDASAYDSMIVATAGNTPSLALAADGGITLTAAVTINGAQTWSDAAGTGGAVIGAVSGQDVTITSGDDLVFRSGVAASDLVKIQAYDVDGSAYADMIVVNSQNAPTLGFFGATPAAQHGTIAVADTAYTQATTTEIAALAAKINELVVSVKYHGLVATS